MADIRVIRIFISSPSDVRPERGIAARVVQRLAREFSYHFKVEAVLWEREPMLASHQFQELIVEPHQTDIVVVLLWSRLGMPLPDEARWRGRLSGRQVTGTEWEFEDALAGHRERQLPDLLLYRKRADVTVKLGDRAAYEEQQRQAELVDDFMGRWFRDADGRSATAASRSFASGAELEQMLEVNLRDLLRRRLSGEAGAREPATMRWHQGSPYRGLEAFGPEHEPIFFGRTRARNEVRELLAQQAARGCTFVLVMGASGSGKSSLVKAGVLPMLCEAGMVGRTALVRYAITRPGTLAAAGDAVSGLSASLFADTALPELAAAPLDYTPEALTDLLRRIPDDAARPIRQGLSAAGRTAGLTDQGEARLLLVVDQLEELFTTESITPDGRERYVAALAALATSGTVWVIATMRSDFFDRLERLPALARLAGEAKYLLTPPDAAEIGQIIRQPAREAGLTFEIDDQTGRGLDDDIREAAAGDAASLPLLEYLLDQLWHRRTEHGVLTYSAYQELGGLEGAIGRRADAVLADLPPDVQAAMPRLLRALVTVRPGTRIAATARHARIEHFSEGSAGRRLIEALLAPRARLLVADEGTLRVAHEALLTHWPRAREQIAEDRADLRLRARLEEMAARWQAATGKDGDSLLLPPGLPLSEAEDLLQRRRDELDPSVTGYIERSGTAARQRQRRATARLRVIAAVMALLTAGASIGAWQAIESEMRARSNLQQALTLVDQVMADTLFEVHDERIQKDAALMMLDRIVPVLEILERGQPGGAPERRWQVLIQLCDLHQAQGDMKEATRRAQAALALASDLARHHPDDAQWQERLADSHVILGDVRVRDDPVSALAAYEKGVEILQALGTRDPHNTRRQKSLATTHEKIGDALRSLPEAARSLPRAETAYLVSLGILAQQPDHPDWQYSMAVVHSKIGAVQLKLRRALDARNAQLASLGIARRLDRSKPTDAPLQRHLSVIYRELGDVSLALNDRRGALDQYQASVQILRDLEVRDPANTAWQDDLAVGYTRIVTTAEELGEHDTAVDAARTGRTVILALLKRYPDDPRWKGAADWFTTKLKALGTQ